MLLTKYNVQWVRGSADYPLRLDDGWLAERFELFTAKALPSVLAQTQGPDQWLVFMDARTPSPRVAQVRAALPSFAELVLYDGPLEDEALAAEVVDRLPADARSLLTSRLDNDDVLLPAYLERVAARAVGWVGFINAPWGYTLAHGRLLRRWDPSSPFLSRLERLDGPTPVRTVFSVAHHQVHSAGPVAQLPGGPGWVHVIHPGNVASRPEGVPWLKPNVRARVPAAVLRDLGAVDLGEPVRAARPSAWSVVASARQALRFARAVRTGSLR